MKVGISGAQSVGKTTLLNALRSEKIFNTFVVCDEITRRIKSYGVGINEDGTDVTQRLVMQEHVMNVFLHDNMLTDRTSLDGLVYTTWLYESGKITKDTLKYALTVFKKVQPLYDYQFYIVPEFDLVDDGVRSADLDFRDRIVHIFEQCILDHKINVVRISGSVRTRVEQVLSIIGDNNV